MLFLKLTLKMFKIKGDWNTVFKIVGIQAAVGFVLALMTFIPQWASTLVGLVLVVYLIKTFLKLEWGKSILVWLVWAVLTFVVVFLVVLVLTVVGLAALFGGLSYAAV
jgi:hypothetical protein